MPQKTEIVFRRKVRVVWLDQGLTLAAQGISWKSAKPLLAAEVAADNSGAETVRKVLEHIRRIWFEPPDASTALHRDAVRLFRNNDSQETRFLLNWGMTIAAYPFVSSVAEVFGRLFKLQDEVNRTDVQRRLREHDGDRDFISRITRYTISSFLDWSVIAKGRKEGIYRAGKTIRPRIDDQIRWLAEAVLISRGKSQLSITQLCQHPVLFPITLKAFNYPNLVSNGRLRVVRLGLNTDYIQIAEKN